MRIGFSDVSAVVEDDAEANARRADVNRQGRIPFSNPLGRLRQGYGGPRDNAFRRQLELFALLLFR